MYLQIRVSAVGFDILGSSVVQCSVCEIETQLMAGLVCGALKDVSCFGGYTLFWIGDY